MNNLNLKRGVFSLAAVCVCFTLGLSVSASATEYSPPVANPYPSQVYWGDTHLHTNMSSDAFGVGLRVITPELAFRFARGETVTSQTGIKARLSRPLDFLLISDHAEFLGVFRNLFNGSPDVANTPLGERWMRYIESGEFTRVTSELALVTSGVLESGNIKAIKGLDPTVTVEFLDELRETKVPLDIKQSIWSEVGEVADIFNQPGRFTAFIGYEWTSMPDGNNLHRNVLFRDDASVTSQIVPFSSIDSGDPEDLWNFMARYERQTGGQVLAIPHNGNLSNGLMFAETTLDGKQLTRSYAERRARWEPIVEVTQMKGDGEAHPFLSPNDEFADFETWDKGNIMGSLPTQESMLEFEYARSALKNGLALGKSLGTNPFAFGMIGSTDSHTGLATGDEDNFFGKIPAFEPTADRRHLAFMPDAEPEMRIMAWESVSAGYAAVWALENTREALFDAMQRKETYATTGPRMTVRFFGGWSFDKDDHERPDLAYHGYRNGVPMGGELVPNNTDESPTFLIAALKDPVGANLDRIQIIKGWLDADGATHEKVYNVAASDGRKIKRNKLKPLGNTVNVDQASYRNSIGDAELSVVWQDPDFDPAQSAFYYVRVLEIPTPRWTTIDAKVLGGKLPKEAPISIQERAYTSPIWYQSNL